MIPRTLVPTDVRPFTDNGDKKPPRRLTTYMDDRTVVPSDLSDAPPQQREIDKFDQPPQMTAQLREIVSPDIFNTGEANLLVEPEDRRDAKWDAITRVISVAAHIAFVIFLIFLPKIFPTHVPTREETELA